jgi:hypothetical protein
MAAKEREVTDPRPDVGAKRVETRRVDYRLDKVNEVTRESTESMTPQRMFIDDGGKFNQKKSLI